MMPELPVKIDDEHPYSHAAAIILSWCKEYWFDNFLVTLTMDGEEITVYAEANPFNLEMRWEWDWWDGGEVYLLGFKPTAEYKAYGYPEAR